LSTHISVVPHAVVQLPQCSESTRVFTHAPLQDSKPAGHAHLLAVQICPLSQALPQLPQSLGFVVVFTQMAGLPHAVVPVGHVQAPAWHVRPPLQTTPQAPQFAWSVCVFTQEPAQAV
jgi:hypothetical protein